MTCVGVSARPLPCVWCTRRLRGPSTVASDGVGPSWQHRKVVGGSWISAFTSGILAGYESYTCALDGIQPHQQFEDSNLAFPYSSVAEASRIGNLVWGK